MVRKIKVVDVYSQEAEGAHEADIESYDDADDIIKDDAREFKNEVILEEEEDTPP